MSGGAKALIEEIRASHYSNEKKAKLKGDGDPTTSPKVTAEPKTRRVRKPKKEIGVRAVKGVENLFDVTIVGGIGLPGFPLKAGEKLAIVKLTPRS
mgnify:CR=1 FL=1